MLFSWLKSKKTADSSAASSKNKGLGICAASLQEQGRRSRQEDSWALLNHQDVVRFQKMGLLAVVADGMGGMRDGRLASTLTVNRLTDSFQENAPVEAPASWLREQLLQVGEEICRALEGMGGSTAVVCLIQKDKLWFASVGDSFLYLLRDGELNRLNRPQTVMQREFCSTLETGSTDPSAGRGHGEAAALTGFLGMQELEDVDLLLHPMRLKNGDTLLLCSDGVGGVLTEEDLYYCFRQGRAEDICDAIRQRVQSKNLPYQDNFTALVIQCME